MYDNHRDYVLASVVAEKRLLKSTQTFNGIWENIHFGQVLKNHEKHTLCKYPIQKKN